MIGSNSKYFPPTNGICSSELTEPNRPMVDRCDHQANIYRRSLCDHCGEKFCDSCEIKHKEKIRDNIQRMGQAVS